MKRAAVLFGVLAFGLLTQWTPQRWPWAVEEIALYVLAGWTMLSWARGAASLEWRWTLLPLAGAVLIGVAQWFGSTTADTWQTQEHVLLWLAWLAAHWVTLQFVSEPRAQRRFLALVRYLAVAIAVLALAHRETSNGKVFWIFETGRAFVMGVFPYENQYAAFIVLLLPLVLTEALRNKNNRWGWFAGAAVMIASVISSSSIAGAGIVLLETLLVIWIAPPERRSQQRKHRLAISAALVALAIAFGAVSGFTGMVNDLERQNPLGIRGQLAESTVRMAADRPMSGWGLGTWTEVYPAYARFDDGLFDNAAHNDWAQWAAEGGLPMLAMMLAFVAMLVRPALRSVWGIGVLLVMAHSLIEFHFQERPAFGCFYFAFSAALLTAFPQERLRTPENS